VDGISNAKSNACVLFDEENRRAFRLPPSAFRLPPSTFRVQRADDVEDFLTITGARPSNGSSISRMRGFDIRPRPMGTICA
jgi:hypothetical protein